MNSTGYVSLIGLSFCLGVVVGYQLKTFRVSWLKAKRERLANKLIATQKELDVLTQTS